MNTQIVSSEELNQYVTGWDENWLMRLLALLFAMALLWIGIRRPWSRSGSVLGNIVSLAVGVGALCFAAVPQRMVSAFVQVGY